MSLNTYPNNPFPPSTEQMHRGDNEELQAQIDAIKNSATIDSFGDVETALATKTDNDVIAPEFDAEVGVYSVGDLVMHEGKLYEFTTAHETAGVWNPEEVTEKTVADEVDTLKSGLTTLNTTINITSTFFTSLETDVSMSNDSVVYKVGKHITGDIILVTTTTVPIIDKTPATVAYKPIANINTYGVGADNQYGANIVIYAYISSSNGKIYVKNENNVADIKYIKLHIDYYSNN